MARLSSLRPSGLSRNVFLAALLLLSALPAAAQFADVPVDARSAAMGGCRLEDESRHVTVGYRNAFSLAGMSTRLLDVGWTLGERGFADMTYNFFGDPDYNEQQAQLAGHMQVEDWLTVGVKGRYCRQATGDGHYDPQQWMSVAATVRVTAGKGVVLAAEGGTRPWDDRRPWRGRLTMQWRPAAVVLSCLALESEERMRFRAGVEYGYESYLFFRAGMATAPLVLTFGLGLHYDHYRIDLGVESHHTLGLTPQISLGLCF